MADINSVNKYINSSDSNVRGLMFRAKGVRTVKRVTVACRESGCLYTTLQEEQGVLAFIVTGTPPQIRRCVELLDTTEPA